MVNVPHCIAAAAPGVCRGPARDGHLPPLPDESDYRCSDDEVAACWPTSPTPPPILEICGALWRGRLLTGDGQAIPQPLCLPAPDHPWLLLDDAPLLAKLSALRRDRAAGWRGATVASLLMFGRFEALRDALPGFHLDYRERLSD